jgi:hypothetical protein
MRRWGAAVRLISWVLGILGGLLGIGVHAALLIRFFSQPYGLFQVFLELLLALVLGLAAIFVAALFRHSPKTLAAFLPLLGTLGFFPRPASWAPAGVLLIAGGVSSMVTVWRGSKSSPSVAPAYVWPDGRPLHWSDAARLGLPRAPAGSAARSGAERWTTRRRAGVITGAVLAAAIVLLLSLGTITIGETAVSATTTSETVTTQSSATAGAPPVSTTTTAPAPAEPQAFAVYTDEQYGFSIKFPSEWRSTDPTEVGQRMYRMLAEAYAQTFVAAAFADWSSPTFNGCYLDYVWIEVYDETLLDVPTLPQFRDFILQKLDRMKSNYSDVKSLEPLQDVTISGLQGCKHVWSIVFGGRTLVLMECVLVADERAYFLQFAAVEDDWDAYEPVFEEILRDFAVSGPGPLS